MAAKYVALSPTGGVYYVDIIKEFCDKKELSEDGFSKCVNNKQRQFSGGWTAMRVEVYQDKKQTEEEEQKKEQVSNKKIACTLRHGDVWFSANDVMKFFGYKVNKRGKVNVLADDYNYLRYKDIEPRIYVGKSKYWNSTALYKLKNILLDKISSETMLNDWEVFLGVIEDSKRQSLVLKEDDILGNSVVKAFKEEIEQLKYANLELKIENAQQSSKIVKLETIIDSKVIVMAEQIGNSTKKNKLTDIVSVRNLKETLEKLTGSNYTIVSIQ